MNEYKHYPDRYFKGVSHRILLMSCALYVLDFFMFNKLSDLFTLQPSLVATKIEFWRIFTFAFVPGSIESVFLFVFTFFFIAPKLELKLRKNFYPLILFLLICFQGTVSTLVFWQSEMKFAGMEGISFFILVLFTLINYKKRITFWGLRPIKSIMLVTLLAVTWISAIAIHSIISDNEILIKALYNLIFGIITGSFTYFQTDFYKQSNKKNVKERNNSNREKNDVNLIEDKMPALIMKDENKLSSQNSNEESFLKYNFILSEKRLNEILDKINEKGKDSLTDEEIQYLKDYSKKL